MEDRISIAVQKLAAVTDKQPISWDKLDEILKEIEDINVINEQWEETILGEYLTEANFYHDGSAMPKAIQHFLPHGYDVSANDGRNGGLALSSLCWSSYDRYILDAAKVLLDAGAPVIYPSADDDPEDEPEGVLGSISWKLSGAWAVDREYHWANILEAYYTMAKAHIAGENYNDIYCHLDCLGDKLTSVETVGPDSFLEEGPISKFTNHFVMWFGGKPLVVSPYTEFVVNPVWVKANHDALVCSDSAFSKILGATLVDIQYIDSTFCYFTFDNGYQLLFASHNIGNRKRIGAFEIKRNEHIEDLNLDGVDYLACCRGRTYADHVVDYEEEAIVFFSAEGATVLYPSLEEHGKHSICTIRCSNALMADFSRRLVLPAPEHIVKYNEEGKITAMRIQCGDKYLYLKTTDYYEIEMKVSSTEYDPSDSIYSLRSKPGERLYFTY